MKNSKIVIASWLEFLKTRLEVIIEEIYENKGDASDENIAVGLLEEIEQFRNDTDMPENERKLAKWWPEQLAEWQKTGGLSWHIIAAKEKFISRRGSEVAEWLSQ